MRKTLLLVAGILAGCSAGQPQFTVGTQTLIVHDQGYFTTTGVDYCNAAAPGEMLLDFVDFDFICDPKNQPERDPAVQHLELQVVLSRANALRNLSTPFVVGPADCENGPTAEAIGRFLHYPANSKTPDNTTQADSGSVTFTSTPSDRTKPWVGSMDLVYGAQHVKSAFTIYACN